jgi:hypothetical protein
MSENSTSPSLNSLIKTIYCQNSGVVLGVLNIKIFEGQLAYLDAHNDAVYLHPFYRLNNLVLLKKLEDCLHSLQSQGWVPTNESGEKLRLRLLMSAMMFNLDSIKQTHATLPSYPVAIASAGRLLGVAKWFFYVSSQRLSFPIYSISKLNQNEQWENFKDWLDSAYEIRNAWASKSKELKKEAEQRAYSESLKEITSEHFRRIDTRKVWNWIWLQLEDNVPPGRIETFKSLFLNGDTEAHEWTVDDVDDLRESLVKYCDRGNSIMFFINKRLDGIAALVRDFYSSFTIVSKVTSKDYNEDTHTAEEQKFFKEFDDKAQALTEMPAPPKKEDFTSLGLFLKSQAQWNILKKRFDQMKGAGNGPATAS